jgi:anti-sigma regulatory factor (Ser/Thr protein kinase)
MSRVTRDERTFSSKECIAEVRAWVAAFCAEAAVARDVTDDVVLVASELATNCRRHTLSGGEGGTYTVRLTRGHSRVLMEVSDQGAKTGPMVRRGEDDGPLPAESGHGLKLVDAFTNRWWVRGGEHGRTVIADVGRASSSSGHGAPAPEPRVEA